jgi:CRISPR/Cas system CSM-associated protein Csm3 (group 7 of RAMP superfamily)
MFAAGDSPSWSIADDITGKIGSGVTPGGIELRLSLELRGGISIREYTTSLSDDDGPADKDEPYFDYSQMIVHGIVDKNGQDVPVIPGTSWAGAFRERYASLADDSRTRTLFGFVSQMGHTETNSKSRIVFEESSLEGGEWKKITRNAIDRITGGTMDGALYTERTYFGGATDLVIGITPLDGLDSSFFEPLMCAIADLHNGFLSVGGLTSIGRGLFRIRDARLVVNGEPVEGFAEELLMPASDGDELIAPDIRSLASMLCRRGGVQL